MQLDGYGVGEQADRVVFRHRVGGVELAVAARPVQQGGSIPPVGRQDLTDQYLVVTAGQDRVQARRTNSGSH